MDVASCSCANLRMASRMVTQCYDAALQPAGVKATQFTLLATLAKGGESPLTRLAGVLLMDRTTLTRNLKPLERRGLVRIEHGDDQRVRTVSLTKAGRAKFDLALPHWRRVQSQLVETLGRKRWSGLLTDLKETAALAQGQ